MIYGTEELEDYVTVKDRRKRDENALCYSKNPFI